MGKRNALNDDMSSEQQPIILPKKKKDKLIGKKKSRSRKMKLEKQSRQIAHISSSLSSTEVKKKRKTIEQKQQIYQNILRGLKGKGQLSKKQRRKNRMIVKRELNRSLGIQNRRRLSEQIVDENQNAQKQKIKKQPRSQINDRKEIENFKKLMGNGLNNLKDIIAFNLSKKKMMLELL